ncbi:MAG: hydrogenase maturation nickel metallochaperone HypA [bacterium]
MHETGRAQSIIKAVLERAGELSMPEVKKVEVLVNSAMGVDKEELLEIIEDLKKNTALKETQFVLKDASMQATCKKCGMVFPVDSPSATCPTCGSADFELSLLDEWEIAKIE